MAPQRGDGFRGRKGLANHNNAGGGHDNNVGRTGTTARGAAMKTALAG